MRSKLLACAVIGVTSAAASAQLSISFEELGTQPHIFAIVSPLRSQIAGATFAGPSALDGGAIVNQAGNWGVNARSGLHFLGFNRVSAATMANGGHPIDPEEVAFAQAWSDVSIWAAGGFNVDTFTMRAFNAANVQVGIAQVATQSWAELRIQAPGIVRIELTQQGDSAWIYDDLTVTGNPVLSYCTAGTTSHGCVASIGGTGTPSASAASGFTLAVANVEGQQSGLIFYGVDNSGFTPLPWGTSSSFMCVKAPINRLPAQSSGGALGACNGSLSVDWNAYRAANPLALGQPFAAGDHVYAQAWFRDPPSPKTTMLSNALEFVVQP